MGHETQKCPIISFIEQISASNRSKYTQIKLMW